MVVVAWIGTVVVERPVDGVWELMDGRRGKVLQGRAHVQLIIGFALRSRCIHLSCWKPVVGRGVGGSVKLSWA